MADLTGTLPQKLGGTGAATIVEAPVKLAGASTEQSFKNVLATLLTPYDFGAVSDAVIASDNTASASLSIADNTARVQAYFDQCRDLRIPWTLPLGNWLVTEIKAYGPGQAHGTLISPNDGSVKQPGNQPWGAVFTLLPHPDDVLPAPTLAEVKGWTGCVRGATKIGGLTGRKDQYITILTTDQWLVDRRDKFNVANPASVTSTFEPIYLGEGFLVVSNEGHIAHPLIEDWQNRDLGSGNSGWQSGTFTAQRVRPPIDVVLPDVVLVGPAVANSDGQGRRACVQIVRCNVNATGGSVLNLASSIAPLQAFSRSNCCNVIQTGARVFGLGVQNTQYGYNQNLTCNVQDIGCSASDCRRGWDATRGKAARVIGGNFPDGMGAHFATDTAWTDVTLISCRTTANPTPISIAGGNLTVTNCNIKLPSGFGKVFEVRADIWRWVGKIHFKGNDFIIDAGDAAAITFLNLQGPAKNTAYDTGVVTEMPSSIIVDNTNRIRVGGTKSDGTMSNAQLQVLLMFNDWDDVIQNGQLVSKNQIVGGVIELAPQIIFDNPDPLPGRTIPNPDPDGEPITIGAGNPKCKISYNNFRRSIGGNYKLKIRDFPDLYTEILVDRGGPKAAGRIDLDVQGVRGQRKISTTYGGTRELLIETRGTEITTFETPPYASGFAPIGDENSNRTYDPTLASTAYGGDVTGARVTLSGVDKAIPAAFLERASRVYTSSTTSTALDATVAQCGCRNLSASRTIQLPAASAYPVGQTLHIVDETGQCSETRTITVLAAGSDTIQGLTSVVLTGPYQSITLRSNGSNLWTYI